jgi:hypothetical protein
MTSNQLPAQSTLKNAGLKLGCVRNSGSGTPTIGQKTGVSALSMPRFTFLRGWYFPDPFHVGILPRPAVYSRDDLSKNNRIFFRYGTPLYGLFLQHCIRLRSLQGSLGKTFLRQGDYARYLSVFHSDADSESGLGAFVLMSAIHITAATIAFL